MTMVDSYTIGGAAIVLTALIVAHMSSTKRAPAPLPPGPKGLPLVGNVADLPRSQPWLGFAEFEKKYGGITHLSVLGKHIMILNDPKYAVDMLDKKSKIYSDRPQLIMAGDLVGWGAGPALIPFGKTWSEYRKLFAGFMGTRAKVDAFDDILNEETHRFLKSVVGKPDKWVEHAFKFAGSIVLTLTYGYKASSQEDGLVKLVNEAMDQFSETTVTGAFMVDVFPSLQYVPSWFPGAAWKRKVSKYHNTLEQMLDQPYQWVKKQMSQGTAQKSFLSSQLDHGNPNSEEEKLIKWAAAGIYSGGADTTVGGIECFFLAMTYHTSHQIRAQEELDTVLGHGVPPTLADRPRLPYVDALFIETMRCYTFAPLGLPHVASEDDIHDGYFIPKGTMLLSNVWRFFHNPSTYPDPDIFKPERFLETLDHPVKDKDPRDYVYGFGRRSCPGSHLADASMWLLCANVLAALDIRPPVGDDGKPRLPSGRFLDGSISHPEPFECKIKPRSAATITAIQHS
ncbi:cytochrome P450 [Pleurotus eryngii]|uniref:Cytochrome P450 n=1 Tax=Pleurotus eryngii TaxID=5323 RepID=A0A9P5ZPB4_PLEER|nr:cytochrome P450 [Pleurotus eryngii]